MDINLSKEKTRSVVDICLSKAGFDKDVTAKVCIVLDSSASMSYAYSSNKVQALVNRALAIGHRFDDDGDIDVFDFAHDNFHNFLGKATQDDHGTYLKNYRPINGGTVYRHVLNRICEYYYKPVDSKKGLLGLFSKKGVKAPEGRDGLSDKHPVFCIFITDGDTNEKSEDERAIIDILAEHKDLFISFIGIDGRGFNLLKRLDAAKENAGFFEVPDLSSTTDEELMSKILNSKAKAVLKK